MGNQGTLPGRPVAPASGSCLKVAGDHHAVLDALGTMWVGWRQGATRVVGLGKQQTVTNR
jgi:hypothetical protein